MEVILNDRAANEDNGDVDIGNEAEFGGKHSLSGCVVCLDFGSEHLCPSVYSLIALPDKDNRTAVSFIPYIMRGGYCHPMFTR